MEEESRDATSGFRIQFHSGIHQKTHDINVHHSEQTHGEFLRVELSSKFATSDSVLDECENKLVIAIGFFEVIEVGREFTWTGEHRGEGNAHQGPVSTKEFEQGAEHFNQ